MKTIFIFPYNPIYLKKNLHIENTVNNQIPIPSGTEVLLIPSFPLGTFAYAYG